MELNYMAGFIFVNVNFINFVNHQIQKFTFEFILNLFSQTNLEKNFCKDLILRKYKKAPKLIPLRDK